MQPILTVGNYIVNWDGRRLCWQDSLGPMKLGATYPGGNTTLTTYLCCRALSAARSLSRTLYSASRTRIAMTWI